MKNIAFQWVPVAALSLLSITALGQIEEKKVEKKVEKEVKIKIIKNGEVTEIQSDGNSDELEKVLLEAGIAPDQVETIEVIKSGNHHGVMDEDVFVMAGYPANMEWVEMGEKKPMLGITFDRTLSNGKASPVVIASVVPESAAEVMGLLEGDEITAINGQKIKSSQDIVDAISENGLEKEIVVEVLRDGKTKTFQGKLKEGHAQMRKEIIIDNHMGMPSAMAVGGNSFFFEENSYTQRDEKVLQGILGDDYSSSEKGGFEISELNGDNFLCMAHGLESEGELSIFNASGKRLEKMTLAKGEEVAETFVLKDVVPGVYFATLTVGEKLSTQKFTVK